jgi:TctA family transporter
VGYPAEQDGHVRQFAHRAAVPIVTLIGGTFFFAIIGVFGLSIAIFSLVLAILFACLSALRDSEGKI